MSESTDSGGSLTLDDLERFVEGDYKAPSRTLIAPNMTVAKLWEKQYPGWTILLASPLAPSQDTRRETL